MRQSLVLSLFASLLVIGSTPAWGARLDISDSAMVRFLDHPFQFDYTTVTNDSTLRLLIDAVDRQLATIEYRQFKELVSSPDDSLFQTEFSPDLEKRYRELMGDGYLFEKLRDWRRTTADTVCRAFIGLILARRENYQADPSLLRQARELAQRIADRLYKFRFRSGDKTYRSDDIVALMEEGKEPGLARALYRQQNDSAALLARNASQLYALYSQMAEQRGFPTSFDLSLSRLSFRRPEWFKIAEGLKAATGAEYEACLEALRRNNDRKDLCFFEIDRWLRHGAQLSDEYFPQATADSAIQTVLTRIGLDSLVSRLIIVPVDSALWPALAVRFSPPDDVQLVKSNLGGFDYYRRLMAETVRTLPWAYADTTIPYLLRDYPPGTGEVLTATFEELALDSAFLAETFKIPGEELNRFAMYNRWLKVFRLRQVILYFFLEYYMSEENSSSLVSLYWSLEQSLLGTSDSSYQWIEVLLTGSMEKYPERLAEAFNQVKLNQILFEQVGAEYATDPRTGRFLIDDFCRPGRTHTAEDFIALHLKDRVGVDAIKRQWRLR